MMAGLVALAAAAVGSAVPAAGANPLTLDDYKAVLAAPGDDAVFAAFLAKLPTVTLVQDGATRRYYLWEGDLPLSREAVRAALYASSSVTRPVNPSAELIVLQVGGVDQFWPRSARALTYAIDRPSFPDAASYAAVATAMQDAAQAWTRACPGCGVGFVHVAAQDAAPVEGAVTFIVCYQPDDDDYLAMAFFPNDPLHKRRLYISPGWLTAAVDRTGILRHELGHILGYRHEQIRGVAGCAGESGHWRPLTPYDSRSVMHYICGKGGDAKLTLTASDKAGHRLLYGAP